MMNSAKHRRAASALLCILAVEARAACTDALCEAEVARGPGQYTGDVTIDRTFDFDGGGTLDADEIQCAIDCLDGTARSEAVPAGASIPTVPGGVIRFVPSETYHLQHPVHLPLAAIGQVVVEGNGATLVNVATAPLAGDTVTRMLVRRLPADANECDAAVMMRGAIGWRVRNLTFATGPMAWTASVAIEIHAAEQFSIENCTFRGGQLLPILARSAPMLRIEDCRFRSGASLADIAILDAAACTPPFPGTCWTSCSDGRPAVFPGSPWVAAERLDSHGASVLRTVHAGGLASLPTAAVIVTSAQDNVVIDGATAEVATAGGRSLVRRLSTPGGASAMAPAAALRVRDCFVRLIGPVAATPVIDVDPPAPVSIDGLTVVANDVARPIIVAISGDGPGVPVLVRNSSLWPSGYAIQARRQDSFLFLGPSTTAETVHAPVHWTAGVPENVVQVSGDRWTLPKYPASTGTEVQFVPGSLAFDAALGLVKYSPDGISVRDLRADDAP